MTTTKIENININDIDKTFTSHIDLISKPLGSQILSFSDEWFAEAANLITPTPPIRKIGVYTFTGAWYDGWETRRHNEKEFDYVVIKLGVASGLISGFEVDTAFFNGNHAPEVSVVGTFSQDDEAVKSENYNEWEILLPKQTCGPSQRHAWKLSEQTTKAYTHVRLQMYPDGGIARFRLYGNAIPVFPQDMNTQFDLAAIVNGGTIVSYSDQHFGTASNLLLPGRGIDMGDGWETKRSRGIHDDWVIVKLGSKCFIDKIVIDTAHFRGNFPREVKVFARLEEKGKEEHDGWVEILTNKKGIADIEQEYDQSQLQNTDSQVYSHAKLVIIPDGGVKRFKVIGRLAQ